MMPDEMPLLARLKDCQRRIGDMCAEGRPPKMSFPAQPHRDDDLVIIQALQDAATALAARDARIAELEAENKRLREELAAAKKGLASLQRKRAALSGEGE